MQKNILNVAVALVVGGILVLGWMLVNQVQRLSQPVASVAVVDTVLPTAPMVYTPLVVATAPTEMAVQMTQTIQAHIENGGGTYGVITEDGSSILYIPTATPSGIYDLKLINDYCFQLTMYMTDSHPIPSILVRNSVYEYLWAVEEGVTANGHPLPIWSGDTVGGYAAIQNNPSGAAIEYLHTLDDLNEESISQEFINSINVDGAVILEHIKDKGIILCNPKKQ